jgi:hypothetical protein
VRLGHEVVPIAESVRLDLDPGGPDYRGSVVITLRVRTPADSFQLNARELTIEKVTLEGLREELAIRYDTAAKERLTLHSPRLLPRGVYQLEIAFRAKFKTPERRRSTVSRARVIGTPLPNSNPMMVRRGHSSISYGIAAAHRRRHS